MTAPVNPPQRNSGQETKKSTTLVDRFVWGVMKDERVYNMYNTNRLNPIMCHSFFSVSLIIKFFKCIFVFMLYSNSSAGVEIHVFVGQYAGEL